MAKELSVLQQQAEAIKTEVNKGANTSSRIGGMFGDILEYNEEKLTELEGEINKHFQLSPFVLINKYDLNQDGWYDISGNFIDSNSDFYHAEIPINYGTKRIIAKQPAKGAGFAICLFKDDTLVYSIESNNAIVDIEVGKYEFNKLRTSTRKIDSDNFFVLLDYVGREYSTDVTGVLTGTDTFYASVNVPTTYSDFIISLTNNKDLVKPKSLTVIINGNYYFPDNGLLFIDDYTAVLNSKEFPIETFQIGVGIPNQLGAGEISFNVRNISSDESILKCFNEIATIKNRTSSIENTLYEEEISFTEESCNINKETTDYANFTGKVPESLTHRYKIECIEGTSLIKPKTIGTIINGVYYVDNKVAYIDDYTVVVDVEETELPITTFYVGIGVVNQLEVGVAKFRLSNIPNEGLVVEVDNLSKRLSLIEGTKTNTKPSIHVNDKIYCVVGDKIQLYYNMFIHHVGDYSLNIECSKGKNYPRYWEYTPTSNDVGSTNMKIQLLEVDGSVIEEKTISIITKNATNPSSAKNILLVGDSLYMSGQIAIELSRRLKGTVGVATSPSALALSNFNIVGRLKNSDGTVGWEGTGGWSWGTYTSRNGMAGVRLTVTGITDVRLNQDCRYQIDGFTQQFYITEINASDGNGYLFAAFYGKGDIYNNQGLMPASGVMRKITGDGQEEINFTASQVESYQPFWNTETDSFDIKGYVDTYCDGHLEILCVQLGINSIISANPFTTDFEGVLSEAKNFIDLVHSQLPNTKIYIATLPLPSQNGGLGSNYPASNADGSYLTAAWNYKVHKVNDLYRSLTADANYNSFVSEIDVCAEMDSDNNYPYSDRQLNTRSTKTEQVGNNGVHPANEGYWQIADTWFRAVLTL